MSEPDIFGASVRLRKLLSEGSRCQRLSVGVRCECPTCDLDRLCNTIGEMRHRKSQSESEANALCVRSMGALAKAGFATPAKGYEANIEWAMRDCIAAIDSLEKQRK